jgi:hypothetical protein
MAETFRNAYALVIGVGADLPVTVADAKAIAKILRDPSRCAIPKEHVRVLTEWNATHDGVIDALSALARDAEPHDVVTVYFSGHGGMLPAASGRRFLVPRDGNWLDGEQFTNLLKNIPARRLLVMLDCCYAGGVHIEPGAKAPEVKSVPVPFDVDELRREGAGTVVLSSSRADEVSWTGLRYSIFTQVIIEALCGAGAARQDGYVRVTDLAMHVAQWVPTLTSDSQHPQLHLEAADNYPVAYYAAGSKAALHTPRWLTEAAAGPAPVLSQPATDDAAPLESPLSVDSAIRKLRDLFVASNLTEEEAKRIVRESGVAAGAAWWTRDPTSFWNTVLDRAHTAWEMEELFAAADDVFGANPDWQQAKQDYLAARDAAPRRRRLRRVREGTPVDPTLYERRLRVLDNTLERVVPSIFRDPRIRVERLDAAGRALLSIGSLMEELRAAADNETQQPRRHELQQLDDILKNRQEAVSQKLSALRKVRSERAAVELCDDLAKETTSLLAACEQAIRYVT